MRSLTSFNHPCVTLLDFLVWKKRKYSDAPTVQFNECLWSPKPRWMPLTFFVKTKIYKFFRISYFVFRKKSFSFGMSGFDQEFKHFTTVRIQNAYTNQQMESYFLPKCDYAHALVDVFFQWFLNVGWRPKIGLS